VQVQRHGTRMMTRSRLITRVRVCPDDEKKSYGTYYIWTSILKVLILFEPRSYNMAKVIPDLTLLELQETPQQLLVRFHNFHATIRAPRRYCRHICHRTWSCFQDPTRGVQTAPAGKRNILKSSKTE
jgi:hypothetical protein